MAGIPKRPVKLCISSSPTLLPVVRAAVEKMCQLMGLDDVATGGVVLSVDEALANVIRHAYGNDHDQPIEIDLLPTAGDNGCGLTICLADRGPGVDPARIKSRDLSEVRPGGLGVHIMHEHMDEVEFRAREGGGTCLVMVKRVGPADSHEQKEVSS